MSNYFFSLLVPVFKITGLLAWLLIIAYFLSKIKPINNFGPVQEISKWITKKIREKIFSKLTDKEIEKLNKDLDALIEKLSIIITSTNEDKKNLKDLKNLIANKELIDSAQLVGVDLRKAIGNPLTKLIKKLILSFSPNLYKDLENLFEKNGFNKLQARSKDKFLDIVLQHKKDDCLQEKKKKF